MELKFIVNKDSIVKEYLKECGISRAMGRKIKLYGKIYVNDCEVKNYEPVKINDEIRIILDTKIKNSILKADKEIDILYEDEWLLVVNKEPNLAIHPSNKHRDDNLVSRVLGYFSRKC